MRILVLGGAGAVCRHATIDLVKTSSFEEIVIGEQDLAAAERLAAEYGDPRLQVQAIDAGDETALVKAMHGFDVVLNGLPFKYDLAVTRACIQAGVNGLDVSTDETQWDYHAAAQENGLVFIPGVGATPGVTNLMARRAAEQLDEVDEITIHFAAFRCLAPGPGLLRTTLWEFHPDEPQRVYYQDGEFHRVGPFVGLKTVNFPGPIGEQETCYIPHPETRTLPHSLGARAVSVHGCFAPPVMRLMKVMLASGLYGEGSIQMHGVETTPLEVMENLLMQLPESKEAELWGYGLVVEVAGKSAGRQVNIRLWNRHPPQEVWGGPAAYFKNIALPLSIGAQLLAGGAVERTGVIPPELAFDPLTFFAELGHRQIEIHEQVESLQVLA